VGRVWRVSKANPASPGGLASRTARAMAPRGRADSARRVRLERIQVDVKAD